MIENPTTTTLRCFIAITSPLTEATRPLIDKLESLVSSEKFRLRIVPPENLHITLNFVGSVDADQVGLLDSILRNQSTKQTPLHLNCRGIEFFNNSLYMSAEENKTLRQFATNLNEALTFLEYPIESARFVLHITLARFRASARPELIALLKAYRDRKWEISPPSPFNFFVPRLCRKELDTPRSETIHYWTSASNFYIYHAGQCLEV